MRFERARLRPFSVRPMLLPSDSGSFIDWTLTLELSTVHSIMNPSDRCAAQRMNGRAKAISVVINSSIGSGTIQASNTRNCVTSALRDRVGRPQECTNRSGNLSCLFKPVLQASSSSLLSFLFDAPPPCSCCLCLCAVRRECCSVSRVAMSSFPPLSTRSARDTRHNRFESYSEPHVYDRVEYWQRKRERWQAENETASNSNDAFATGGLFAGFGQRNSPQPALQQQHHSTPQQATGARVGFREQQSRAYDDARSPAYQDRTALRPPPPLFPSISSHRSSRLQPKPDSTSASNGYPSSHSSHPAASAPSSYMSGVHELHGGPSPDEQRSKKEAQRAYQITLQQQMREKEERKVREKRETEERERREEEESRNYNPFGRGGGGAPMRDSNGHIVANRSQALAQSLSPTAHSSSRSVAAATSSSHFTTPQQRPAVGGYAPPALRGRVGQRSDDTDMAARQQEDRQQWQHTLAQQIEEKASKKRREEELRREEDRREEERLEKERSRMDEEWKREREKEQQKQRAAQEEHDNKARKAKEVEGLTDYEREQAMKGRKVQQPPQPQQQQQSHREEERKETIVLASMQPSVAASQHHQHGVPHPSSQVRGLPFTYDELEREMDRLRADIRQKSDKAREKKSEKQRQQRQQSSLAHDTGSTRRRQRMAALEEDDDTNIARFLNKQNSHWRPEAEYGHHWQQQQEDDGWMELDTDVAAGVQLAGNSTFVPLPADYDSRLGTPEAQPQQPSTKQQPRQPAQIVQQSATSIQALPPPPPPPAKRPSLADDRPLPALAKQTLQVGAAPPVQQSTHMADTQPAAADEEELYADEEFVVEDAQLDNDDQQYEEDELVAGTEQQLVEDEVVDVEEQYECHRPSEYSKVVSDTDIRDDDLDRFVTSETDDDNVRRTARKRNGRKKWGTANAVQAAA